MRELVILHRRDTAHRRYRVGREYPSADSEPLRPDHHQLHAARGRVLPPEAELAQFLLMKVVASATRGRRKTALGMDVTGAYSTLWNSSEGRRAVAAATQNDAPAYFKILAKLTGGRGIPSPADRSHPKVQLAVKAALDCWERDEKTLIFCFRLPTATVLRDLIANKIDERMKSARSALLRGRSASSDEDALAQFRKFLTARTGSVLPAFMDRVLLGWAQRKGWQIGELSIEDLRMVAEFAARARIDGKPAVRDLQKLDRVLLARICEHVLAIKYRAAHADVDAESAEILARIGDVSWIETRYGSGGKHNEIRDPDEAADVLTRSSLATVYELSDKVDDTVFRALLRTFVRSSARESAGLLDSLIGGPNIFVPLAPFQIEGEIQERARCMTEHLWKITFGPEGMNWEQRGEVVDAVNRALLREHFLLRLPRG